jgi:N-acetyldiaminopimelate deacetylase
MPNRGNDAISAAVDALSTIHLQLARAMEPMQLFLFHSGKISGGTARNIVADKCTVEATARALSIEHLEKGVNIIKTAVKASAEKFGCEGFVALRGEYIETVNSPESYNLFVASAKNAGVSVRKVFPMMTGEDFGYFTRKYSGLMFWIGTAEEGRDVAPLHAVTYCPSSKVIQKGVAVLFAMVEQIIRSQD